MRPLRRLPPAAEARRSLKPATERGSEASDHHPGRAAQGRYGPLSQRIVSNEPDAGGTVSGRTQVRAGSIQRRDETAGHDAASRMRDLRPVLVVVLMPGIALVPVIVVAPMLRRFVAVGCGSTACAAAGIVMKHAGHCAMRQAQTSPSDEEAEQNCCHDAEKAHTCR